MNKTGSWRRSKSYTDTATGQLSKSTSSSNVQLRIGGVPCTFNKELMASRSAKLAGLLKEHPDKDLSYLLRDMPADPGTFKLVVRFCQGLELNISTENVVPLACLAHYLGMTENYSINNLLQKALTYFEEQIIPSWNESVKALKASENVLQRSMKLGLVDACVESITSKALANPSLLGEPTKDSTYDNDREEKTTECEPNPRRRLFVLNQQQPREDLTSLSLKLYEPVIEFMIQRQVPLEYVAASLCRYAKRWVFSCSTRGVDISIYTMNSQRAVVEAVERLLPHERGLLPSSLLFEMLCSAVSLEASSECRKGFEIRIGKQLDQATVKDLLIPYQGYAKEVEYDVECVKRILKNFYCNYTWADASGLIAVADLVEGFLAEVASDKDLKTNTFISLADVATSASVGTQRSSDGIYRAIDIYFDKHSFLTESEREEVCKLLDCHKMSPEACQHAAQNERLPIRVAVQALFVSQLHLRDTVTKEVKDSDDRLRKLVTEQGEETARVSSSEEDVKIEMEKMGSKVMELERECYTMKKEIQKSCCSGAKKEKVTVWREMKRKFGCMSSMHDCNCHVKKKKVHPRN